MKWEWMELRRLKKGIEIWGVILQAAEMCNA
jgi:hypothetical protein